MKQKSIII